MSTRFQSRRLKINCYLNQIVKELTICLTTTQQSGSQKRQVQVQKRLKRKRDQEN